MGITNEFDDVMKTLSEDEILMLETILSQVSKTGSSKALDELWEKDYEEMPVDIYTFITDKRFLGETFVTEEGKVLVYPYWIEFLKKIFTPGCGIFECALSGAIGIGKSTIACIGLSYILHRLLCLKDPARFYKLTKGSRIGIALINLSMSASYGVGYAKLQSMLKLSPWFLERGELRGLKDKTYYPGKNIDIVVGSKMEHFIGRDIFAAFLDEMDYMKGADVELENNKVMKLYTTIKRRIESRYMQKGGNLPGMLFLVSSKRSSADFLENYIKSNLGKPYLAVADEPVWVVKAQNGMYCGETFRVAVGNKFLKSKVLGADEDSKKYEEMGQRVINVPIEYTEAFRLDINSAMMDIAGIALDSNSKFIDYERLSKCYKDYLHNPFKVERVVLSFDDDTAIKDYLDMGLFSVLNRNLNYYIHWDTSKRGDCTGLAMTTVEGGKSVRRLSNGTVTTEYDVIHKLVFGVKITPIQGQEIPFYKIREFIYWLRDEMGFKINAITCDSYQSVDTIQQFKLRGFNSYTQSVDRTMAPYNAFRNAINEGRFITPYIQELESDCLDIEYDAIRDKVDHSTNGAKDLSDAVAGSIYASLIDKENMSYRGATTNDMDLNRDDDGLSGNWITGGGNYTVIDDEWSNMTRF